MHVCMYVCMLFVYEVKHALPEGTVPPRPGPLADVCMHVCMYVCMLFVYEVKQGQCP
jgi:hypothetical protein